MVKLPKVNLKLAIFIFLCFLAGLSLLRNLAKVKEVKRRVDQAKTRLEELKKENERLEAELKKITTDEYLEKQLRDKLGLAKEGEIVVVLPEAAVLRSLVAKVPEEEDILPDPIWKRWLKLFGI